MGQIQETLSYVVSHNLFASSTTAFGRLFSQKDRNLGRRIIAGDANLSKVVEKFKEKFGLTIEKLQGLAKADQLAMSLYKCLADKYKETEILEKGYGVGIDIIKGNYEGLPEDYVNYLPVLKDLRFQQREHFLEFVALFFLKLGNYRLYNTQFIKAYHSVWKDMQKAFYSHFSHRHDLHSIMKGYAESDLYCSICHPSVWGMIQYMVIVLDVAENPEKIEERLRAFHLFDWNEDSYWKKPDVPFVFDQSEIWWLYTVDTKVPTNGYYIVIHIRCGENKDSYELSEVYNLIFIEIDNSGENSFIVHLCEANKTESFVLGLADYDKENHILQFHFDDEVTFPESLQIIDMKNPICKEEKIWKNIMDYFVKNYRKPLLKQAKDRLGGFEFLDNEYLVIDVVVGRRGMFIGIENTHDSEHTITEYSIELEKHPFLKCIHPSDDAYVIRRHENNELYVTWLEKDIQIALKEFTCM